MPKQLWKKGQSGNPSGRAKGALDLQLLARTHTQEALQTLIDCMRQGAARDAIQAAKIILERGWGKPAQAVELSGNVDVTPIINLSLKTIKANIATKTTNVLPGQPQKLIDE